MSSNDKQFGQFVRQRRRALGLSLREFAWRNGLQASEVSRLERGLVPPPRTQAGLEVYAKALKLSMESGEWDIFRGLAHRGLALASPVLPPGRRYSARAWSLQLEQWADQWDARATLPQLVRRLVHGTVNPPSLQRVHIPTQEGVQQPGWDGLVLASEGNAFVPTGLSAWEMSVQKNPGQKAEADFNKRTQDPGPVNPEQTTFVFVTLRRWARKEEWCADKRRSSAWQDVRVYDAGTLDDWLEQAGAVGHWLARHLGLPTDGVDDIAAYWRNCTESTNPSLPAAVYLASRAANIKQFTEWYCALPSVMAIETPSPYEALDFVAACYAAAADQGPDSPEGLDPDDMAARTLVVKDAKAWPSLIDSSNRLALIAAPGLDLGPALLAETVRNGHHALLAANRLQGNRDATITLARPSHHALQAALRDSGADDHALTAAYNSGGSLAVLKRSLPRFPATKPPEWSRSANAKALLPLVLVGSWDETYDGDRQVVAQLSSGPYSEVEEAVSRWLGEPDTPVLKRQSVWSLVSREDSWRLLAPHIGSSLLERFTSVAHEVLGEVDGRYNLPPAERAFAPLQGIGLKHSEQLRNGISETLALLACKSDARAKPLLARRGVEVAQAVLAGADTWQKWATLSPLLPTLAEACPVAFLGAVEKDLKQQSESLIGELFRESVGERYPWDHPYLGLVGALEVLAWHPDYLSKASVALVRCQGRYLESWGAVPPMESLAKTFLPWWPSTAAPVAQRIGVLKALVNVDKRDHEAWQLLLELQSSARAVASPTSQPRWLALPSGRTGPASSAEYWQQIDAGADLLMDMAGTNAPRLLDLLEQFIHLPELAMLRLAERIGSLEPSSIRQGYKKRLVALLAEQTRLYRLRVGEARKVDADILDQLARVQAKFEADGLVLKHGRLFADLLPDGWDGSAKNWRERLQQERKAAIREIHELSGLLGVIDFAKQSQRPDWVGRSFAEVGIPDADIAQIFPGMIDARDQRTAAFAREIAHRIFLQKREGWLDGLGLDAWQPKSAGILLAALPVGPSLWQRLDSLGEPAKQAYWAHRDQWIDYGALQPADLQFFLAGLLRHAQASRVVWAASLALNVEMAVDAEIMVEALELLPKDEAANSAVVGHQVEALLRHLQTNTVDGIERRLESLEWKYLFLLRFFQEAQPDRLLRRLRDEPAFFCEVVQAIYPAEGAAAKAEPSEAEPNLARHAAWLLARWKDKLPGKGEDEDRAERVLVQWVKAARKECERTGHLRACDSQIGRALATEAEPAAPDAGWPSEATISVLEDKDMHSEELHTGFVFGALSKRGSYSKLPEEGGATQRAWAERYEGYAEACQSDAPITAELLRRVARDYEEWAKREDEVARARGWLG